jgi:hypothetical protein
MRKRLIIFCLLVSVSINLLSQNAKNLSSAISDTGYIIVDGGKLFYESAGKGTNIVLLHDGMVTNRI